MLYRPPELRAVWLAFVSFLPQFALLYIPAFRESASDLIFSSCLQISMLALAGFAWLNRAVAGMKILLIGLVLNLVVIVFNGGFMPIAPSTASALVSQTTFEQLQPGDRFGAKDIDRKSTRLNSSHMSISYA